MRLALGELLEGCDIVANESFLLGPAPSLEPSFTLDGIRDAIKPLRKDQFDRQAGSRVSWKRSSIVLGNSCLKRRTRRAYIHTGCHRGIERCRDTLLPACDHPTRRRGLAAILRDARNGALLRMRQETASKQARRRLLF